MAIRIANILWRLLLGALFLLAAWGKWKQGINYFPPYTIYDRLIAGVAIRHYCLLACELGVGIWLVSGLRVRQASAVAGLLLLAFTGLLAFELWRESPAACGCGLTQVFADGDPRAALRWDIARNAVLLLGCIWLLIMGNIRCDARPAEANANP